MKTYKLQDFTKGWFIGDFSPSLVKTKAFEVAVKYYKTGEKEEVHFHKIAEEYTVIVAGKFQVNGKAYVPGDVIQFNPMDVSRFVCVEDGSTIVVKIPSVANDKYIVGEKDE